MATRRVKQAGHGYLDRMFVWLARRFVRWLLLLIAIPLGIWVAEKAAEQLEQRRGPSKVTRTLRAPGRWRRGEPLLAD